MKVYFVGIKGTGMSALSLIYRRLGFKVVGSDVKDTFFTEKSLKENKIKYYQNFDPKNIVREKPDLVITSVAWQNNVEVEKAKEMKIKVLTYPQGVAKIFNSCFGIAVCGTHGKSTTTAFLGKIFELAKLPTIALVGAPVKDWQSPVFFNLKDKKLNSKVFFILEADEYRQAFLNYYPKIILVTNIDYDHPDFFKNKKIYRQTFKKFFLNLKSPSILVSFSRFKLPAKIKQINVKFNPQLRFDFYAPGKHWQRNLTLILALTRILKLENYFYQALKAFKGVSRRFDILSSRPLLIDDYAHHPHEILSFYRSVKEKFPQNKFYFIFQPHTYSRTQKLFKEFKKVFQKIENLIIFKTFSSAREGEDQKIENKLKKLAEKLGIFYFEKQEKLINFLLPKIKKGYGICTCGAGNVYEVLIKIKKLIQK